MIIKTGFFSSWYVKIILILITVFFMLLYISFINPGDKTAYLTDDKLQSQSDSDGNVYTKNEFEENAKPEPREVIIVIDPGHGGEDWGTYYGDMYEKNLNLDVSLRLGKLLQKDGVKVIYTREKDDYVGLRERSDMANELDADLFISIHNNKMPDNPYYKGTETLYCPPEKTTQDEMNGEKFATVIQRELVKTLKTVDNGIISRPNLSVLHRTKMPAVITEICYISNSSDRDRIGSTEFRQKAADALNSAILKVLEQMKANKSTDGKWMLTRG